MGRPRLLLPAAGVVVAALLAALATATPASAQIWWANENSDSIGRAELDGTGADGDAIAGATDPNGVAIDGGFAYWSHAGDADPEGAIGRAPLDGSSPPDQAFVEVSTGTPGGVAVDTGFIYWTQSRIGRAGLDGAPVTPMFISDTNTGTGACGIASDGDEIIWGVGPTGSGALRAAHGQFAPNPGFLPDQNDPCGVARARTFAYWTDRGTDAIGRVGFDASAPDPDFVELTDGADPCGVAADENFVYWTDRGTGAIGRAPLADPSDIDETFIGPSAEVQNPCGIAVTPTTDADPASHAFAETEVGAASDIQALFIANTGSSVLEVDELTLTGANPEDFELTGDACTAGSSPSGGGCVVNVRFHPTAGGERTATLSAASNASDSPTAIALSGTGTPATDGGDPGGGDLGGGDPPDGVAPELSDVRVKPARFLVDPDGAAEVPLPRRRGTRFAWTLSEPAVVGIAIEKKVDGRVVNGACVPERPGNRDNPECTRLKFIGSFAAQSAAAAGGKEFSGRIGKRRLRKGAYRATVQALDASFNFSLPSTVRFRVVERRR